MKRILKKTQSTTRGLSPMEVMSELVLGELKNWTASSSPFVLLPCDLLFTLQMSLHLNLMSTPKNNTGKEPEGHEGMCSISPFMSTTHLCNNHMQPGAQSNEFSSRMQIKKHSGSKKDVQLLLEGLVRSVARIGNPGIKAYIPGDNVNYFNTNQKQRDREHNSFHLPFSRYGGNVCFHFHHLESQERFLCTWRWETLKLNCSFQSSLSICGRYPELNYLRRSVRTSQVLVCLGPLNTSKLGLSPHLSTLPTFTWLIPSPDSGLI